MITSADMNYTSILFVTADLQTSSWPLRLILEFSCGLFMLLHLQVAFLCNWALIDYEMTDRGIVFAQIWFCCANDSFTAPTTAREFYMVEKACPTQLKKQRY